MAIAPIKRYGIFREGNLTALHFHADKDLVLSQAAEYAKNNPGHRYLIIEEIGSYKTIENPVEFTPL